MHRKLAPARPFPLLAALAMLVVVTGASVVPAADAAAAPADEALSHDGLRKIRVKGLDTVYAAPGASLSGYTKVRIDPIDVSFRKDFAPKRSASRIAYTTEELASIREGLARLVREEFVQELQRNGYAVVDASGPDVLRVRPAITNLYVNAPDLMEPGRGRSYTMNAGEMTLVAELIDSDTGATIARVVDRREGRETGQLQWTNAVTNAAEARTISRRWARILRTHLDAARGIGR